MKAKFKAREWWPLMVLSASLLVPAPGRAQTAQAPAQPAQTPAQPGQPPATPAATRITLQQAIDMAIQHNHSLQAARTMILQNQAQETTANLRPNPTISGDTQFLPILEPSNFNANYFDNDAQFDIGVGYLFERGKKRQHRLQAAKDQTAVTMAQVTDNERTLTFSVASQFITALQAQSDLAFALQDLASFQNTVQISEDTYQAGSISEGDLLKIKLQVLQFQMDVSQPSWRRCRRWPAFASCLGYESVAENYEVLGELEHSPMKLSEDDLKRALQVRPDLHAAQLGVTASQSQYDWRKPTASAT